MIFFFASFLGTVFVSSFAVLLSYLYRYAAVKHNGDGQKTIAKHMAQQATNLQIDYPRVGRVSSVYVLVSLSCFIVCAAIIISIKKEEPHILWVVLQQTVTAYFCYMIMKQVSRSHKEHLSEFLD
jgi:hypothetical protein